MATFMLVIKLKPGIRNQLFDAFEQRGPSRSPGLRFVKAWIDSTSDTVFGVFESTDAKAMQEACKPWQEFGELQTYPVIDIEKY